METKQISKTSIRVNKTEHWDDSMNPRGKIINVWRVEGQEVEDMPLTMRTDKDYFSPYLGVVVAGEMTMGEIMKGLVELAEKGGPCFPGYIEPLTKGQMYGVTMREEDQLEDYPWIAFLKAE